MKKFGLPILLVAIVGALVTIFLIGNNQPPKPAVALLGDKHPDQGQKHLQPGEQHDPYNSDLPSSGPHNPAPAPWGSKDSELPDETLVHNLEHGGIVIAYKPDLPADDLKQLKGLFAQLPPSSQFNEVKAVLVPRAGNTHPIQLAAWTYTLNLDQFDAAKIKQFYEGHLDKGPELVP